MKLSLKQVHGTSLKKKNQRLICGQLLLHKNKNLNQRLICGQMLLQKNNLKLQLVEHGVNNNLKNQNNLNLQKLIHGQSQLNPKLQVVVAGIQMETMIRSKSSSQQLRMLGDQILKLLQLPHGAMHLQQVMLPLGVQIMMDHQNLLTHISAQTMTIVAWAEVEVVEEAEEEAASVIILEADPELASNVAKMVTYQENVQLVVVAVIEAL